MKSPITAFLAGLLIGCAATWFHRSQAIADARGDLALVREEAARAKELGTDARLVGYSFQGISGGNGTVYLHNTETGAVWLVTPDGIKPVPAPLAP
jgi:hypothetical protein